MHRSMKIPELIHIKQWTFSHELRFNLNIKTHSIEPNLSSTWHRITYICTFIHTYGIDSNALSKNKNRKFKQKESYTRRTNIYSECVTWTNDFIFKYYALSSKKKNQCTNDKMGKNPFFLNMKEFFIESTVQFSPTTRIWWVV